MESITEPKEQQQGGSTISASTTEQNVVDDGVLVTAVVKMSNQLWIKYHSIEMKRNQPKPGTEFWSWRIVLDGGVAGCEEEDDATRVPDEGKPNWWVGWMRKE